MRYPLTISRGYPNLTGEQQRRQEPPGSPLLLLPKATYFSALILLVLHDTIAASMSVEDLGSRASVFDGPSVILTGEGINALTPDHVAALRTVATAMAGGLLVEAELVSPPEPPIATTAVEAEVWEYCKTQRNVHRSRIAATWATIAGMRDFDDSDSHFPGVQFIEDATEVTVDLPSLYTRLVATGGRNRDAWAGRPTRQTLHVIAEFVNHRLRPYPPLYFPTDYTLRSAREKAYPPV